MHSCLQVHEILDLTLSDLFDISLGPQSKHDLVSAGLACQYFLEVALDILWKTQTSLVPLIKTLPQDRWCEDGDGFDKHFRLLVEALTLDEQARFAFYAKRIRRINYATYAWHKTARDGSPYDLKIVRAIWKTRANKEAPLFPSLQHLEFARIEHASTCLDVFLQTKQVSLSLFWSHSSDNMDKLIPVIKKYGPNMQELNLGSFQDIERNSGDNSKSSLSSLVVSMKDLRGLSCGPHMLNAPAIAHLSALPRLRKLHLPHDSQEILLGLQKRLVSVQNSQSFPELQELFIRETKLPTFTTLLSHFLRPLQIRDLTLQLSDTFDAQDVAQSFAALSNGSSHYGNVHKIKYKHIWLSSRRIDTRRVDSKIIINGSTLSALPTFTNLTVLELDIRCAFDLGDSDIMTMADAWPRLRRLQLGSFLGWHLPSRITFDGFLHLLLKCPDLEHLAFAVDTSSNIPTDIKPGHINKKITYLYIGDSKVTRDNYEPIGKLLSMILPNCCGFGGQWQMGYREDNVEEKRQCQSQWVSIQRIMKRHWLNVEATAR